MTWAKFDDGFHDHPKVEALLDVDGEHGVVSVDGMALAELRALAALGLELLAATYAGRHLTDGAVRPVTVRRFAPETGEDLAARLVEVGLWDANGSGWVLHDFLDWNPAKVQVEAERTAAKQRMRAVRERRRAEAAARAGQQVGEGGSTPAGEGVDTVAPAQTPTNTGNGSPEVHPNVRRTSPERSATPVLGRVGSGRVGLTPSPTPTTDPPEKKKGVEQVDTPSQREDVERICSAFADHLVKTWAAAGVSKPRPKVTAKWRQQCRLLMDTDGATERQALYVITWLGSPSGSFWATNVQSIPKLREQWARLAMEIKAAQNGGRGQGKGSAQAARQAARAARVHGV